MRSGPSQSIQAAFSQAGIGAAMCQTLSRDERSYPVRTASGSRQMRSIMVGTMLIHWARCSAISRRVSSGSNFCMPITVVPRNSARCVWLNGPLW